MSSNKSRFRSNDRQIYIDILHVLSSFLDSYYRICLCVYETMSESDNGFSSGMDLDPAFASIPKNKSCLCIWRVEVCLLIGSMRILIE
jgi:hypothetical protein